MIQSSDVTDPSVPAAVLSLTLNTAANIPFLWRNKL